MVHSIREILIDHNIHKMISKQLLYAVDDIRILYYVHVLRFFFIIIEFRHRACIGARTHEPCSSLCNDEFYYGKTDYRIVVFNMRGPRRNVSKHYFSDAPQNVHFRFTVVQDVIIKHDDVV